jgi:Tfp pilus assembly protein PilX
MNSLHEDRGGQRGIALVIAMLVLLVATMLAVMLIATVQIERQVTGHDLRATNALNVAEAGVSEAMARIRSGDIDLSTGNPLAYAQIYNTIPGSVPSPGANGIGLATSQPAGSWLQYSTNTPGPDALTVEFKTDANKAVIYRYDSTKSPPENTTTGLPIYVITSTGVTGTAKRTVVTEVIQKPFNALAKAALAAGHDIDFVGNAVVCGYNHSADTPAWDGKNRRGSAPDCMDNETGSGNLPGSWSTGNISGGGASYQVGQPVGNLAGQTGFYSGPWDAFGMSQADFLSWVGAPVASIPGNPNGIFYVDNNGTVADQSANLAIHGGDGEGLLYVDGDLTMNAQTTYRGLIYVEGDLKLNGQAWILGGLIVKGKASVRMNGGATILYSSDAISRALAKYGGQFVTLSWRELP